MRKKVDIDVFISLWNDYNLSVTDIAKKLNVCKSTVLNYKKKCGFNKYRALASKIKKRTGSKVHNMTLLEYKGQDSDGHASWLCKCKCGNEKIIRLSSLTHGSVRGCGCSKFSDDHYNYELITSFYWKHIQWGAKSRKRLFTIDIKYAWDLYEKQNRKCALSGVDITLGQKNQHDKVQTASLDRIDIHLGYIEGNVQWIHKRVNRLKNILTNDELIFWSNLISESNKDIQTIKYNVDEIR